MTTAASPGLRLTKVHKWLLALAIISYLPLAAVSFRSSFKAVQAQALQRGFAAGEAWSVPVGVDVGIVCLSILDLLLTGLRMPFPLLRQVVRGLTVATIWFNAAAGHHDPVAVCMRGILPTLFILYIEAFRFLVRRYTGQVTGAGMEGIPLARWLVDPVRTASMKRRMVLWNESSYERALQIEQQVRHARAALKEKYGDGWKRKAPGDVVWMLKTGVHVEEACARVAALTAPSRMRAARGLLEELYGAEWRNAAPSDLMQMVEEDDAGLAEVCQRVAELTAPPRRPRPSEPQDDRDQEDDESARRDRQRRQANREEDKPRSSLYELAKPDYLACKRAGTPFDVPTLSRRYGSHPGSLRKVRKRLEDEFGPIAVGSSDQDAQLLQSNGADGLTRNESGVQGGGEADGQASRPRVREDALN